MGDKKKVGIGLVGAGFMGRCHANAFRSVSGIFDLPVEPDQQILADVTPEAAKHNANLLGYRRSTGDWKSLCTDPLVDIVAVTAPNALHEPIVMEAIKAGKTVYCEKPLSTTVESSTRMTEAAESAGILTLVGFNFLHNPLVQLAKEIIEAGEIGEIVGFRGRHAENYMCDPDTPHSFRTQIDGGGAVADIGSHIISMARYLLGPIVEVSAQCETIHKTRPIDNENLERAPVEVDDITNALIRFENGTSGSLEANWAAFGRTMDLSFEVTGTKGAVFFTQERMNELHVATAADAAGRGGFKKIEAGPAHIPYGNFCPAPGHHLGFNDLKVIEVAKLLNAYSGTGVCKPDFREALEVQRTVEAMQMSSKQQRPVRV